MKRKISIPAALNIVLLLIIAALIVILLKPVQSISVPKSQFKNLHAAVDSNSEQEALNIAFDKLMSRPPTAIRDIKYLWQLAPFVGKNIEIFGISKDKRVKNADKFVVNGNDDIIIYGCDQGVKLGGQGVTFSEQGEYVVSDYLLLRGRLCFEMFTEESLKEIHESGDDYFPRAISLYLADIEVKKIFKTPPSPQERPDSIRLAVPSARCKEDFNAEFLGLARTVNMMPFLRFIASLGNQAPGKAKEIFQRLSEQNYDQFKSVNSILELVPFLGSYVEIKGRLEKGDRGNPYGSSLIINENNKLSLSMNTTENYNHRFGQSVICRGKLFFGCKNSIGDIYLGGVEYVDNPRTQDDLTVPWVIRRVPEPYFASQHKKSFFTGFSGDANYIVFRSYITEIMRRYPHENGKIGYMAALIKSARQGNTDAQCKLGECYAKGDFVRWSEKEATEWYCLAAERGSADAQYALGKYALLHKDEKEAVKWLTKAAHQGNPNAQFSLSNCYMYGKGTTQNSDEAVRWCRKAAEHGNAQAQSALGFYYKAGVGVEKNDKEANAWLKKGAEQGDARARNMLKQHEIKSDQDAELQYWRGRCLLDGIGVPKNDTDAVKYLEISAARGYTEAEYTLGICYNNGYGVSRDYDKATELFSKAATKGNAPAQIALGNCYDDGNGVPVDHKLAFNWYLKAAEQGSSYAEYSLGWHYENGEGVEKNFSQAVEWYMKAAEQGDAEAQYSLGNCYMYGKGVPKNDNKAAEWLKKAVAQEHKEARIALRKIEVEERY